MNNKNTGLTIKQLEEIKYSADYTFRLIVEDLIREKKRGVKK